MARMPTTCPSCSSQLVISRLACEACDTHLEGKFDLPALLRLAEDDLQFVTEFVLASGSLKEMAKIRGQSYPTIRNRLNEIIQAIEEEASAAQQDQHRILDAIAKGEMSVAEGARRLRGAKS